MVDSLLNSLGGMDICDDNCPMDVDMPDATTSPADVDMIDVSGSCSGINDNNSSGSYSNFLESSTEAAYSMSLRNRSNLNSQISESSGAGGAGRRHQFHVTNNFVNSQIEFGSGSAMSRPVSFLGSSNSNVMSACRGAGSSSSRQNNLDYIGTNLEHNINDGGSSALHTALQSHLERQNARADRLSWPVVICRWTAAMIFLVIFLTFGLLLWLDVTAKSTLEMEAQAAATENCKREFELNHCAEVLQAAASRRDAYNSEVSRGKLSPPMPHMERVCREWQRCMDKDPRRISNRLRLLLETLGEGWDGLFAGLSRWALICSLSIVGVITTLLLAFAAYYPRSRDCFTSSQNDQMSSGITVGNLENQPVRRMRPVVADDEDVTIQNQRLEIAS